MTAHLCAHPGVRSAPSNWGGIAEKWGHSKKNSAFSARIHAPTFNLLPVLLAGMFHRKHAIERWYNFPAHLISVSVLPCKTGNTEITSFHSNVCCFATKQVKIIAWYTWVAR